MSVPLDSQLVSLLIHDLRNPLNAIGMALHMIEGELPESCAELREDVAMIAESSRSLRRMLKVLSDYNTLLMGESRLAPLPFDPRRVVAETVAELTEVPEGGTARIHLEVEETAPPAVELDEGRARLALRHALANAVEAAGEAEVRVRIEGRPGRWVTRIAAEQPPPDTVRGGMLGSERPFRLLGNAVERRGLELVIVANVSERLGGTAAMEVEPGLRSSLVLDWPTRPAGITGTTERPARSGLESASTRRG
jgi:light-regulated signal transduction histidine kinase (bacteriophytochrome)